MKTVEQIEQQLAKANGRISLLERVEKIFNESPELTFGDVKSGFSDELNKFAIEHQIKAVDWFSENYCDDEHSFLADKAIEQLRKGGESQCDHNFVSADNEHVIGAVICTKCHTVTERKGGE